MVVPNALPTNRTFQVNLYNNGRPGIVVVSLMVHVDMYGVCIADKNILRKYSVDVNLKCETR